MASSSLPESHDLPILVGKGKRVDLAATEASLLLTDDAFKPGQQSVTHDGLSEPRLKFIHVLKSLEGMDKQDINKPNHERIFPLFGLRDRPVPFQVPERLQLLLRWLRLARVRRRYHSSEASTELQKCMAPVTGYWFAQD